MATGEKSYTPAGNMRPPMKLQVLQWVKLAWDAVSEERSFRVCGITVNPDGSEDSEVSCLKEGGVAHEACQEIEQRTATLEQGELEDSDDPFAGEDEEELEEDDS